jgi:hypothetical protein
MHDYLVWELTRYRSEELRRKSERRHGDPVPRSARRWRGDRRIR